MGKEKPNREMIRPLRRFTLCAAALLLAACGARPGTSLEEFRTTIYRPAYAAGFEIVGAEGLQSTILRTRTPWQGAAEGTATALFIARNGETPPAGFDGQTVEAGAQRIVCMSSTHVAMLDAVGAAPRIVGVSGRESIANGYVAAHPDRVGDVGYDGNVNYERLLSLRPDLVLLFGVNGASPMEPKLRELGIPFCYIGEYLEESPLGKAEWLVAVAEIADIRERGEAVFAPVPERYEALKTKVAEVEAKPKVMINTPYGDSWFMASTGSYVARLIADAGGDYTKRTRRTVRCPSTSKRLTCWLLRPTCGLMSAVFRLSPSSAPGCRNSPAFPASAGARSTTATSARMPPEATIIGNRAW